MNNDLEAIFVLKFSPLTSSHLNPHPK